MKMRTRLVLRILAVLGLAAQAALGQSPDSTATGDRVAWRVLTAADTLDLEPDPDEPVLDDEDGVIKPLPFFRRAGQRFEAFLGMSNVYDSNIDHNDDALRSYGFVPALTLRFRDRDRRPILRGVYNVGRHTYTNTDKWDRTSHQFGGAVVPDLRGAMRTLTTAEVSLRGNSEDRDISNQYQFQHEFEYRVTDDYRLHAYGTFRYKYYPGEIDRNAYKPNFGFVLEQKLDGDRTWEIGARYEWKLYELADERDRNYTRWTFDMEYDVPLTEVDELKFELTHRRKSYKERFVEIEDEDFLRRDFRWQFSVGYTRPVLSNIALDLRYKFERRDSNDPDKLYNAHLMDLSLVYQMW